MSQASYNRWEKEEDERQLQEIYAALAADEEQKKKEAERKASLSPEEAAAEERREESAKLGCIIDVAAVVGFLLLIEFAYYIFPVVLPIMLWWRFGFAIPFIAKLKIYMPSHEYYAKNKIHLVVQTVLTAAVELCWAIGLFYGKYTPIIGNWTLTDNIIWIGIPAAISALVFWKKDE
jgi:cation transport ATPase